MEDERSLSPESVVEYARRAGIEPGAVEPESAIRSIVEQDGIVAGLDDIGEPGPPDREHWAPDEATDPNAAFLARCEVRGADEGTLAGRRIGVKDNIAVAGVPMTCGSPLLEGYVPPTDATVVERLLDAGGRIVGKTNMDEFALGGDADAMRFRLARNPADREHQPGGSSAGSGVAVADGLVDLALGTDTGGSVRFPASFCGVVGIKPTRGLVPLTGFVQFSKVNDTIGALSRTVEDAARALDAMAGEDPSDEATRGVDPDAYVEAVEGAGPDASGLTVGVPEELFGVGPEVEAVVEASLERLADRGATVREVSIPDFEYAIPAWWAITMTEAAAYFESGGTNYWQCSEPSPAFTAALADALEERPGSLGPYITDVLLYGHHLVERYGGRYYAKAQRARRLVTAGVDSALDGVDVLASPTTPMTAPKWGEGYLEDGTLVDAVRTTAPFNLTGHPAVSVPCGELDGLPVGLQFVADRGEDAAALAAAATWEAATAERDDRGGWTARQ